MSNWKERKRQRAPKSKATGKFCHPEKIPNFHLLEALNYTAAILFTFSSEMGDVVADRF